MLKTHLKLGWRYLTKNKLFTLANILGLSLSISIAVLIYILVQFDFSHDQFHTNKENIYRVVTNSILGDKATRSTAVESPFYQFVKNEAKGIQFVSPMFIFHTSAKTPDSILHLNNTRMSDLVIVNEEYFDIFKYEWIIGNKESLKNPFSVVLTKSRAEQYFRTKNLNNLVGKPLIYFDSILVSISGIIKDMPENSELIFKEFLSLSSSKNIALYKHLNFNTWRSRNSDFQLFLMKRPTVSTANLEKELLQIRNKNIDQDMVTQTTQIKLQNIADIHFDTEYGNYKTRVADISILNSMMLIALFFLFVGCANFINLSTAYAPIRAKEIGIRKTLGSLSNCIGLQFLLETAIILCFALIGSMIIFPFILSMFRNFIPLEINFNSLFQLHVWLFIILLFVMMTLIAGLYPGFILSKFQPVSVLKGGILKGSKNDLWMRRGLILVQFIVAQLFVSASVIVIKQIYFLIHKDPGFRKNAILSFYAPFNFHEDSTAFDKSVYFIQKLTSIPGIEIVSRSMEEPISQGYSSGSISYRDSSKELSIYFQSKMGDSLFFKLYNIPLLAGKYPRYNRDSSYGECIINEAMLKAVGLNDPYLALGKSFNQNHKPIIVGVCKNFNMKSFHDPIPPLIYRSYMKNCSTINIGIDQKINKSNYSKILDHVETIYATQFPNQTFNYSFIDEELSKRYNNEKYFSKLLRWCLILVIILCNIGLLGLTVNVVQTKQKEIGIRKVFGASVFRIVKLILKEYTLLIIFSTFISFPLIQIFIHKWFQNFAYQTPISWWIMPLGMMILMTITLSFLGFYVWNAARMKPIETLRNE